MKAYKITIIIRALGGTDTFRVSAENCEDAYDKALEVMREYWDDDAGAYIDNIEEAED
jgi:hypothetical protein